MTADNSALLSFVSKAKTKTYKQPEWKNPKPCIVCGESFLPYQKKSLACSQDCKLIHVSNSNKSNWQSKDYAEINCKICNTLFKPRQENGKYCSKSCSRKKASYVVVNCANCKKTVKRNRHGSNDRAQYCSKECSYTHRAEITKEIHALRRIAQNNKPKIEIDTYLLNEIKAIKRIARKARASKECKHCGQIVYSKYVLVHPTCRKEYKSIKKEQYRQTDSYKQSKKAARSRRKALERGATTADTINPDFILDRDKYQCYICGIKTPKKFRGTYKDNAPEIDHIIPLSRGGLHIESNLRCSCRKCNGLKSDTIYQLI